MRVVVVFQIGAVEHQQDDQQSVQLVRTDERVLLPPPVLVEAVECLQLRPEARLALGVPGAVTFERPRRQVVNRLLVVAESPEDAREQDLRLRLGADLRAPFHAIRIRDGVFRAEARCVALFECVNGVRLWCVVLAADSPGQVARFTTGIDPQLLDRGGGRWMRRRLYRDRTTARGDECEHRNS